jgi:hypothetical protein
MNDDPLRDIIEYQTEAICTGYVIVATTENIEGDINFYITTLTHQTASTTLGLLESAAAGEKYRIARSFTRRDDDD